MKKNILYTVIVCLLFTLIYYLMGPVYEGNDDWAIAFQLSRGAGSFATFLYPYLSLAFILVYSWIPSVAWWSVFLAASALLFMLIVVYYTVKKTKGFFRLILLFVWFVLIWLVGLEYLNFTRTAVILSLSGFLIIYFAVTEERRNIYFFILRVILGCFFYALGCMVRFEAALLILPFCGLCFFIHVLFQHKKNTSFIKHFSREFLYVGLMLVVAVFVNISCSYAWDQRPEWKSYQEYNTSRADVQDYLGNYPSWEEGKNQYEDIGISEIDLNGLYYWFTEDTSVYSTEKFSDLKETMYAPDFSGKEKFIEFFQMVFTNAVFWILLSVLILYCITLRRTKLWIGCYLSFFGAFLILLYFVILGRMQLRVMEPVFLCAVLSVFLIGLLQPQAKTAFFGKINSYTLILKNKNRDLFEKKIAVYVFPHCFLPVFIGLLLIPLFDNIGNMSFSHCDDGKDFAIREKYDYFNSNSDKLYFLPVLSDSWNQSFGIWERVPASYSENVFHLGGWPARSPYNQDKLSSNGIINPARSLFTDTNVYSLNDDFVFSFLKYHYGEEITCTQVDVLPANREDTIEKVVVKYTGPMGIQKEESFPFSGNIEVSYLENLDLYDVSVPILLDYNNLYLNIVVDGKTYTYFLENKGKAGYSGLLIGASEVLSGDIENMYLLGNTEEDVLVYLGDIANFSNNQVSPDILY